MLVLKHAMAMVRHQQQLALQRKLVSASQKLQKEIKEQNAKTQ